MKTDTVKQKCKDPREAKLFTEVFQPNPKELLTHSPNSMNEEANFSSINKVKNLHGEPYQTGNVWLPSLPGLQLLRGVLVLGILVEVLATALGGLSPVVGRHLHHVQDAP
jgi:hypothetical protein